MQMLGNPDNLMLIFTPTVRRAMPFEGDWMLTGVSTRQVVVECWQEDEVRWFAMALDGTEWQALATMPTAQDMQFRAEAPEFHPLNHGFQRQWSMREAERVSEWVQPLTIMEKMAVIEQLGLKVVPMAILGVTWSKVLSVVPLGSHKLIHRTLGIAQALPAPLLLPQPHDTLIHRLAVLQDARDDAAIPASVVLLHNPKSAVFADGVLWVMDEDAQGCSLKAWGVA